MIGPNILNLPNISLLGINQNYRFFGAGLHYSNAKTLSINGQITDLINLSGISGVWTGQNSINSILLNQNFENIILNNYSFGSGRILNFSFDAGSDVQIKGYSLSLEVFESGNLYNFTGGYYSGINTSNIQYLQDFSESYIFNKKLNGGYSYVHNASIRFNSGVGDLDAVGSAKVLAKSLFTGYSIGFAFYSGYTSKLGKRFYNESYNLITNECEFSETFEFDSNQGNYSFLRTNGFQLSENGIINVSENAIIKGIERITYQNAVNALDSSMNGAYNRCMELFNVYYTGSTDTLISSPLIQGRTLDIFNNNLTYNIIFSNDRSNSGLYFWNYNQQLNYSNGVSKLVENGTIIGKGGNRTESFENAKNGLIYITSGIFNRSLNYYLNQSISYTGIFIEEKTQSFAPYQGITDYNYVFSNEQVFPGTGGVKNIKINEINKNPIYLYTKFGIFNEKEIIQEQFNETNGEKEINIELIGERGITLDIYLENAKTVANSFIPTGINTYISSNQYSFDENNNLVELSIGWKYNKTGAKTINLS